jgi:hypothetical protein
MAFFYIVIAAMAAAEACWIALFLLISLPNQREAEKRNQGLQCEANK